MSKMAQLHAEGVKDLHDYETGYNDGYEAMRQEAIKMVQSILNNEHVGIVPIKWTLAILLRGFDLQDDEEDDE